LWLASLLRIHHQRAKLLHEPLRLFYSAKITPLLIRLGVLQTFSAAIFVKEI
jgi:hypothetical protein